MDAVVVATPDHWHALITVKACEAGKHVYVEKPTSHTIAGGRAMVEAARRYDRVVQAGTQQRSNLVFRKARDIVRSGRLGPVSFVRAWNYSNDAPDGMGSPPDRPAPPELDWDFWLGPAPVAPYNPARWSSWRQFWDYGGGQMTDWGTHHFDIVHWAMEVEYPLQVSASGGKFVLHDIRETPDTLKAHFEYPDFVLAYEVLRANRHAPMDRGYGILFYGTDATLFVDRGGYQLMPQGDRVEAESFSERGQGHLERRAHPAAIGLRHRRLVVGRRHLALLDGRRVDNEE